MDNNLEKYATVTYSKTGGRITLQVTLPPENPRKKIPPMVFDVHDAVRLATDKYNLKNAKPVSGPQLENRPRTNLLKGTYVVEDETPPKPTKTTTRRTRTKKTSK